MSVLRGLLLLWLSACIWLPVRAHDALVISKRNALTQDTGAVGTRAMKKRSTNSVEMVEVQSIKVLCTVTSRFAHTVMTSKALNKAKSSQEIFFEVELPKTAFITNFTMEIDGQVHNGEVKEKENAKQEYDQAVSTGQTAGLVKASGRKMETFSVSVSIAAKSSVTFILIYEELLQRKQGQYELLTRVKPKQHVQDFQIVTYIYEPQGISFVEVKTTFQTNDLLPKVKKTVIDTKAFISISPTSADGEFIINYDVKRREILGEVQILNGYFVHFFAPPDLPRVPKNVVFVIDRSGSMAGERIQQTRDALASILKDLYEEDHFALIMFDSNIVTWKNSLSKATKENVDEATVSVQQLSTGGATNINDALLRGVSMLVRERQDQKLLERSADMIILLTDGMPNQGETDFAKIQENVRSASGGKMSMFCLGFGNDVDYAFLDVLCRHNKGLARRIFEGSDAASQLKDFYKEVSIPLLLEVDLRYPQSAVDFLTNNHYSQLFNGSEIVVAGQLRNNDRDYFLVEVFAYGPDKDFRMHGEVTVADWGVVYPKQKFNFGDFTERLWAYLTIQQLLEKSDIGTQQERDSISARALNISMRYSFVTPLTSMVVTKPETEEGAHNFLLADKLTEDQRQEEERDNEFEYDIPPHDHRSIPSYYEYEYYDTFSCSPAVHQFITHLCIYTGLLLSILHTIVCVP
ncbi:inter-alpha-trypsin inhibitor heavy chain H3-like [Anabas testudineus]|uniref:inter-alpha-trypsin inhibitor heavy chain H3-like n=1 Tax=Anabas testudineus TaxID=64144 RepID=UPI000E45A74F|nr:inter-alpha-trypsin inhibitor heavy chain H3-like [Anabas testudineus]